MEKRLGDPEEFMAMVYEAIDAIFFGMKQKGMKTEGGIDFWTKDEDSGIYSMNDYFTDLMKLNKNVTIEMSLQPTDPPTFYRKETIDECLETFIKKRYVKEVEKKIITNQKDYAIDFLVEESNAYNVITTQNPAIMQLPTRFNINYD